MSQHLLLNENSFFCGFILNQIVVYFSKSFQILVWIHLRLNSIHEGFFNATEEYNSGEKDPQSYHYTD